MASAFVVLVWAGLSVAALGSHDDLAGVAVVFLAVYAFLALLLIWCVVGFVRMLRVVRELRSARPE